MIHDMVLLKEFKYLGHFRTGKGIASIGGSMVSRNQRGIGSLFIEHKGSYGNTTAKCFLPWS